MVQTYSKHYIIFIFLTCFTALLLAYLGIFLFIHLLINHVVATQCPALTSPKYTKVVSGDPSGNLFNETIVYACAEGHEQISGDLSVTCLSSKAWSGETPICRSKLGPNDDYWPQIIIIMYNWHNSCCIRKRSIVLL